MKSALTDITEEGREEAEDGFQNRLDNSNFSHNIIFSTFECEKVNTMKML